MCQFASGILTKTSVLWGDSDSHTDILAENGITDDVLPPTFIKYELIPPNDQDWDDISLWKFKIDQDVIPSWFNPVQDERSACAGLARRFPKGFSKGLSVKGYLDLRSLTSLPANAKLSAGSYLDLRSLTSLPANAQLSAGGCYLDLSSLTSLPANAKLSAGGYVDLRSLKGEIPPGVVLKGTLLR